MIIICHRGNLNGKSHLENSPDTIKRALDLGFHAEIDVWKIDDRYFLGHDAPQYEVSESFLIDYRLWCHAKNYEAFFSMIKNGSIHCFWHDKDDYTITSKGFIWAYPGKVVCGPNVIACMPEMSDFNIDVSSARGVCTDYPLDYVNYDL